MKKILALVAIVVISVVLWLTLRSRSPVNLHSPPPEARASNSTVQAQSNASASSSTNQQEGDEDAILEQAYRAKRENERQEDEARERREYSTPITFYGLVLDHSAQAVPAARVEYDCVGGSFEGDRELLANEQGRFTISGIRGKRLRIRVTHPGYYNDDLGSSYFVYAGNDRGPDFKPDPANPVVFRLRKKGEAAELIRRSDMVLFNAGEKERSFSFYDHSRRRDQPDFVVVRPVDKGRKNSRGKNVLDLELSVPRGGIQLRTDRFQFTAPNEGYASSVIAPPKVGTDLIDFFVRFENGNSGRFTIAGGNGQYDVESYLNPDKSPNLEFDPEKEITFVQTGKMGVDLVYPAKKEEPKQP